MSLSLCKSEDYSRILYVKNGIRMTPTKECPLPYGLDNASALSNPYWSTLLRATEISDNDLQENIQVPKGTWVAVRYTGEFITAKTRRALKKLYDERNWLSPTECPLIVQYGKKLEVFRARRA